MSTASSDATTRSRAPRRRGYLIDPRFQLKYTAMLVSVVLVVIVALGVVIGRTANGAAENARVATAQAERALKESATSAKLLRMSASSYDSPELAASLDDDMAKIDRDYEASLADLRRRADDVERQRKLLFLLLVGGSGVLLLVLAAMGIFITHRIVGPVFLLKRHLRQVGTSRLVVPRKLRKGDELADLFDTFVQMTWSLRALQIGRLDTLEATITKAKAGGCSDEVVESLRALRAQLRLGLSEKLGGSMRPAPLPIEGRPSVHMEVPEHDEKTS